MGGKSLRKSSMGGGSSSPSMAWSATLLAIWFGTSVCSTLVNKSLMDEFPYAVTLSAVHMLSAALVDFAIVWSRGLSMQFRRDVLISCLPVALTITFGKTLTYVSYGMVPASLTHTAKASSPVFSVILSKLLFNQVPTLATFLSLLPITIGVALSALTEINWVFMGFLAAVCASLANVLNSMYTKKALHQATAPDPIIFHMYTATAAVCMLLPYALVVEMPSISLWQPAIVDASHLLDGAHLSSHAVVHVFPWSAMLLSLGLHYAQNLSNIYFLSGVSVLTHQVAQSLKRLLNIAGAVFYFGNRVTAMNVIGMLLALVGFSMYSAAKQRTTTTTGSSKHGGHAGTPHTTGGHGRRISASNLAITGSPAHTNSPAHVGILVDAIGGNSPATHAHSLNGNAHAHGPVELQKWLSPRGRMIAAGVGEGNDDDTTSTTTTAALHPTAHAHTLHHAHAQAQAQAAQVQMVRQIQMGSSSPSPDEDDNFCV